MDVFSHGLWSAAIYKSANIKVKQRMKTWLAVLFGIFPDVFSFAPLFIWLFGGLIFGYSNFSDFPSPDATEPAKPDTLLIFKITSLLYNFSHSLIAFVVIFGIAYLIFKRPVWEMFAWLLHILIDIPTHSYKFYPTPFLWPASDFKFNGFLWSEPWFIILNYSSLVIVFILLRKKYGGNKRDL
ncbi:MAG: hypothetical protein UW50_C0001G0104 [Candidatus Wolfebacteria bacterium GW2011_GWA1_44_24]|uniref:Membrane-bound metal-dependent hydrolase n=2 Tax=Candidatus Wolfeibacteriota TaxID=1752735 RepID=A0A0G0UJ64_9BACT|nr:MAG: hypothetical protein UU38_C0003G0070 [Candidatus Wolfebacteria bacterium GW2011_GWB1_41_12]KKT56536.1 MAG: hypothetical protein UW50_C0001G0104 [Candidatus Wolfebacteria bacterium GW2011_GWA1_44_24]